MKRAAGNSRLAGSHRTCGHDIARSVQHVVHFVVAVLFDFVLGDLSRMHSCGQKAGRHQCEAIIRRKLIACDLPAHELVIRHSLVQRLDDKVAVVVGRGPVVVVFETMALSESREVQPEPPPALAVVRVRQQFLDQLFVGIWSRVVLERGDFCRGRW
jgi:hypothetical protein